MAGIFALLYGLIVGAGNIANTAKNDVYMHQSQKNALAKKKDIFYDRQIKPYWTQTGEAVDIIDSNGEYIVIGKKSKKIYKNRNVENKNKKHEVFEKAIELAKEKNMKYFQWYFDTDYRKDCITGYEIETGKKYLIINDSIGNIKIYKLFYLNDIPNKSYYTNNGICYYYFPYSVTECSKDIVECNGKEIAYGFEKPRDKYDTYESYIGKVDKIIDESEFLERSVKLKEYSTYKAQCYDRYSPF